MAREIDLIVRGTRKAPSEDKRIEEEKQLKMGNTFLSPWQQAEGSEEEVRLERSEPRQQSEKFKEETKPENELQQLIKKSKEETTLDKCSPTYNRLFQFVKGVMDAARTGKEGSLGEGYKIISEILKESNIPDSLHANTFTYQTPNDLLVCHSINVFIYSVKIGRSLGYHGRHLSELGLAAALHDIGMTKVPEGIVNKKNLLSDNELNSIKKHPVYGHEIIMKLGTEYTWLAKVVLQEHEREQGQGYPKGIKGNQIHEYAKIIGAADVYEALTQPRPHRRQAFPCEAIEELKTLFSLKILRAFLNQLTIYPPGCYVKLNSNVIGKVVGTNPDRALQPVIEQVCGSDGRPSESGRVIDLSREPFLHIVECLHQEDIPYSTS